MKNVYHFRVMIVLGGYIRLVYSLNAKPMYGLDLESAKRLLKMYKVDFTEIQTIVNGEFEIMIDTKHVHEFNNLARFLTR